MPKLIVMLRVKDGIQFVGSWLDCFEKLVDEIVVLDNGSTDGTYEILKDHAKVVDIARTEGYNEGRDKNILYSMVRKRNPNWCIWVDVDEMFESDITRADFDRLMNKRFVNKYAFRRYHFIDTEHFAGSGDYFFFTSIHDRIMWRESSKGYFENFILDSPNIKGITGIKIFTDFRLKHLGYIDKNLVNQKAELYRNFIDPKETESIQRMAKRMDLSNEKKISWIDDRKSVEVRKLNSQLNRTLMLCLFRKGLIKISQVLRKSF